jgi:hypothetical protein
MKNADSLHPKNYTLLSLLDGVGGDLFWLDEKNCPPHRGRAFGGEGVGRRKYGKLGADALITRP